MVMLKKLMVMNNEQAGSIKLKFSNASVTGVV